METACVYCKARIITEVSKWSRLQNLDMKTDTQITTDVGY